MKNFKTLSRIKKYQEILNTCFLAFDCNGPKGEKNGFFPDDEQCDLYYECVDGVATPNLCPDGLMFDDTNNIEAKCDYPFNVDCGTREYVRKFLNSLSLMKKPY